MRSPATCHPDKPMHGRGFCNNCYQRFLRGKVSPPPQPAKPPPSCHPDRALHAHDLCYSCYQRDWKVGRRRGDPVRRATYNRKMQGKRYKLTEAQFEAMRQQQNGQCAACGDTAPLEVDHCHMTGEVRGLLCRSCNAAAGQARDDAQRLRLIADYLDRFAAQLAAAAGT